MRHVIAPLALLALSVPAAAQDGQADEPGTTNSEQAYIPFADRSIRNWRVPERDVLLIEANHGRWYRAEFLGRCPGLRFTQTLGFDTNSNGRFDRFSSVVTRDQRCRVRSLVQIPDPDDAEETAEPDTQ